MAEPGCGTCVASNHATLAKFLGESTWRHGARSFWNCCIAGNARAANCTVSKPSALAAPTVICLHLSLQCIIWVGWNMDVKQRLRAATTAFYDAKPNRLSGMLPPPPLQAYRSPQTKEARGAAEESARQKALSALGDNGYESAALYRAFKTVQSKAMRQVGLKEGALLFLMTRPLACLDCVSIWSSGDLEHC